MPSAFGHKVQGEHRKQDMNGGRQNKGALKEPTDRMLGANCHMEEYELEVEANCEGKYKEEWEPTEGQIQLLLRWNSTDSLGRLHPVKRLMRSCWP